MEIFIIESRFLIKKITKIGQLFPKIVLQSRIECVIIDTLKKLFSLGETYERI